MHDETIYAERMLVGRRQRLLMSRLPAISFLVSLRRVLDGGIYFSEPSATT